MKSYHKAIRYGFSLHGARVKDCLHDSYVRYYDKTGKCLLNESIPFILYCMKMEGKIYYRKQCYLRRGEIVQRQFVSVGEDEGQVPVTSPVPDAFEELSSKEGVDKFYSNLSQYRSKAMGDNGVTSDTLGTHLDLLLQGYKKVEIAEIMGVSPQVVTYWDKLIKKVYEQV